MVCVLKMKIKQAVALVVHVRFLFFRSENETHARFSFFLSHVRSVVFCAEEVSRKLFQLFVRIEICTGPRENACDWYCKRPSCVRHSLLCTDSRSRWTRMHRQPHIPRRPCTHTHRHRPKRHAHATHVTARVCSPDSAYRTSLSSLGTSLEPTRSALMRVSV